MIKSFILSLLILFCVNANAMNIDNPEINSATATTQSPGDNSTKVATTAYVATAVGGGIDHGNLSGLTDDDHNTLYLLTSGARALAGAWDMGSQNLTNVNVDSGAIDGVTLGTNSAVTEAQIDNININGSTISSSGDIILNPTTNFSIPSADEINITAGEINITSDVSITGFLGAGNIHIDGNTISSTDANGDINLTPNGTGDVVLDTNFKFNGGAETFSQYSTEDATNPTRQSLNLAHDSLGELFDAYWDGSDIRSSDAGSNYFIGKENDSFFIGADYGVAVGDVVDFDPILGIVNGQVIKLNQSRFSAWRNGDVNNITGDSTVYTVVFNTEEYDIGGNYNNSTGVFTASVDGVQILSTGIHWEGATSGAGHDRMEIEFILSNGNKQICSVDPINVQRTANFGQWSGSVNIHMDAGDTASVGFAVFGGTKVVDVEETQLRTYFTGTLLH